MKALLLTQEFPPQVSGGIAAYYYHLCRELGAKVAVLTPGDARLRAFDGAQPFAVYRLPMPVQPIQFMRSGRLSLVRLPVVALIAVAQYLLFTWHTWRQLRRAPDAMLLVGHLYLAPLGRLLAWLLGRRYSVLLHGGELHRYWHWWPVRRSMLWGLNGAAFLVVNSQHTQEQARGRGVRADLPIQIIHPGVDSVRFAPPVAPTPTDALLADATLLSVARLVEWKGQDTVLRALPTIRQAVPAVRYIIAGSGPYRAELERLATELGVAEAVEFTGFVAEAALPGYYAQADIVVLPSREIRPGVPVEGFGITLLEAAAAGKPVVAGNVGGTQDAVVHGQTGLLVDPTCPTAVAAAVLQLLNDRPRAVAMGACGRRRAEAEFSWAQQATRLEKWL